MPKYFLMHQRLILRLEDDQSLLDLEPWILEQRLDPHWPPMNQEQANYRVAIFRDEILELEEFRTLKKKYVKPQHSYKSNLEI